MIFVDHSNLVGAVQRKYRASLPITRLHYESLLQRLLRGHTLSSYRDGRGPVSAWVYIPDQGLTHRDLVQLINDLQYVPALRHRGGLVDYDRPGPCRSRVRTSAHPGWRECGLEQRAIVEKMIDVSLTTDMVAFACKDLYDIAFLNIRG